MNNLYNFLEKYKDKNIALGFSGGNDSSCLLLILKNLNINVIPVFVLTELTKDSLKLAKKNSNLLGYELEIIKLKILNNPKIRFNTKQRCYLCKKMIYSKIKEKFENYIIFDGTNYSDTFSYRPGIKALNELGIISPFKDCKIEKKEILNFLKKNNQSLISPSYSCIATKFDYNTDLKKVL